MRRGWYNEGWRHSLSARGIKTGQRRYNYTPTFVAGDLPVIAADGVGTAGAAAVPLIPVLVTAGAVFVGAKIVKKEIDKNKSRSFTKKKDIEFTAEPHENGKAYPITKADAKKIIDQQDPEDVRGIKAVRFEEPKNVHQEDAWAQYKRGKREIVIFSQPEHEITPQSHMMMKEHVVPHEIGHHVALNRRNITDPDLRVAEARADAFVAGFDVEDRDVRNFVRR